MPCVPCETRMGLYPNRETRIFIPAWQGSSEGFISMAYFPHTTHCSRTHRSRPLPAWAAEHRSRHGEGFHKARPPSPQH